MVCGLLGGRSYAHKFFPRSYYSVPNTAIVSEMAVVSCQDLMRLNETKMAAYCNRYSIVDICD